METYIGLKAYDLGFDAHLTLIYLGRRNQEYINKMKFLIEPFYNFQSFVDCYDGIEMFGPNKDLPIIRVQADEQLSNLRSYLIDHGAECNSKYSWNPHITLPKNNCHIVIPKNIRLSALGIY